MVIEFLGGALEIGGSSILTRINHKNILFDAGIRQGASKDPVPNFRVIQEYGGVDAIVISHAHLDHIGCLPIISKEYPNAKIYMNNMTKDLVRVLLYDSLKIMNNREAEIPLYADFDVESTLNRIFTINYEVRFPIFEDIFITFYNAGHIAGASCVYVETEEGALFYSGDFSTFSQRTVEGAKIPKLRPDVAIIESTYGDKLHSNRDIEEDKLIDIVKECVECNGKMIIPAFALGRAQEVILILKRAINKGQLKNVNVYVDGMVRDINRVYKNNPLYLKNSLGKKVLKGIEPFYDERIIQVKKNEEREEILNKKETAIIISSSGMLTGGPSAYYAEKIAAMDNGYIVITGYQDEESPGRKILDLIEESEENRVLEINTLKIPVKCTIRKVGLSAHGDKSEIKGIINRISPKNIFLVHGNKDVIKSLGKELSSEVLAKVYSPKCGERIEININNPRKQFKKRFKNIMGCGDEINENNIKYLWEFIDRNYGDKLFTTEDLMYIWHGKVASHNEEIIAFQKKIIHSVYFENDNRRLFLFKVRVKDEVALDLEPRELKENELIDIVSQKFKEFNYKKISLKMNEKKVILNFDFPHALDESIEDTMMEFERETSWRIEINDNLNNNMAETLIKTLLNDSLIKKISVFIEKKEVLVLMSKLGNSIDIEYVENEFKKLTGWRLCAMAPGLEDKVESDINVNEKIWEANSAPNMDQNKAFSIIDSKFKDANHKPYKKSIKNDKHGKLIELAFISPNVGFKYEEKIISIVNETGWRICISDKINQNELISIANMLCNREGIVLKKNPSYNPQKKGIYLNVIEGNERIDEVKNEFEKITGVTIY